MPKAKNAPRADLAEREPTQMHTDFADWIAEQTGVEVDVKSIQLGTLLRGEFQKSEINQSRMAASKEAKEAAAEARAAKAEERAAAKAAKAEKAAAKKAAAKEKAPAAKKAATPAKKATGAPRRRPAPKKG
jgi:hypothetical protein